MERVALQVKEDKISNVQVSANVRHVAKALYIWHEQFSKKSCKLFSYIVPINFCKNYFHMILRLENDSHFSCLLGLSLIQNDLGISSEHRQRAFIFEWFCEYPQLPNLENRKSAFNRTGSVAFTKSEDLMSVFCVDFSCPICLRRIKCENQ